MVIWGKQKHEKVTTEEGSDAAHSETHPREAEHHSLRLTSLKHGHVAGEHDEELVVKMREAIKEAGHSTEGVDDKTLIRFLRARSHLVPKAAHMYLEDVKWRTVTLGDTGIDPKTIEQELRCPKSFIITKEGERPWVHLVAKLHDAITRDLDQYKGLVIWSLEKTIASLPPGEDTFDVLVDLRETTHKNMDVKGTLIIFDVLQAHYPERLHRLIAIHVPYIFWGLWSIVKHVVDKRTREKIIFVEDAHILKVLSEEVPKAMLAKYLGGEAELVGHWEKFVAVGGTCGKEQAEREGEVQVVGGQQEEENQPAAEQQTVP